MRWQGRRRSARVEDRRGRAPGGRVALGGCGTIAIVLLLSWLTGTNPLALLQVLDSSQVAIDATPPAPGGAPAADDPHSEFVSVVLADTEDTWARLFTAMGTRYELPRLVLFTGGVRSACGFTGSAAGPFYCPADSQVYMDLAFFSELDRRFGAPGDFAQAYVIAHEVGHHVQNQLGISSEVRRRQAGAGQAEANELSVRLELQADCLAGVWGHWANRQRSFLEPGDVEEGLAAAAAIGDDAMQRQAGARVRPESWTHGSSEMRVTWLRRGLASGDPDVCDTFGG